LACANSLGNEIGPNIGTDEAASVGRPDSFTSKVHHEKHITGL
jgi:hypothetical protein